MAETPAPARRKPAGDNRGRQNDGSHPMSYWDTGTSAWTVAPGAYTVYLGNSSDPAALATVGTTTVPN